MSSIIDRALRDAKLDLERNAPVDRDTRVPRRRAKDWSTVIGLCRKLESNEQIERDAQSKRVEESFEKVSILVMEVARLERENEQLKLREGFREIELPKKDQELLLKKIAPPTPEAVEEAA